MAIKWFNSLDTNSKSTPQVFGRDCKIIRTLRKVLLYLFCATPSIRDWGRFDICTFNTNAFQKKSTSESSTYFEFCRLFLFITHPCKAKHGLKLFWKFYYYIQKFTGGTHHLFTIMNTQKKGNLQFCFPGFLGIHRNPK